MKKLLIVLVTLLTVVYLVARLVPLDPEETRPGLSLGGEPATGMPAPWDGRQQIYLGTNAGFGLGYSITVVAWFVGDELYMGCRDCAQKRWPKNAARDPQVTVKAAGKVYRMRITRITDEAQRQRVTQTELPSTVWLYHLQPDTQS